MHITTAIKDINEDAITDLLVPRFINYTRITTTSNRRLEGTPSTPEQWDLARALAEELKGLGIQDVLLTDHCYVIARLPASPGKEALPVIGFLAHLDTVNDVPSSNVQPQLVKNYDGNRIELKDGYVLDPAEDSGLAAQRGRSIIHSDGTTLLGADDKAGMAEIVGAAEYLLTHPELVHGPVELMFSPDEEIGRGLPEFPRDTVKSVACYTLDGGPIGELEIECFNAWVANVEFHGKVIHVGAARGILVNAALMAASYAVMLPRSESPEATDGYYGYFCPLDIKGDLENATLEIIIRDFDLQGGKRRLDALESFARAVEAQFPGGTVTVKVNAQYSNMKESIDRRPEVLEKLRRAADNLGIEFQLRPIRGGTDGSRLTELGIPTPNIFTGGRNAHSRLEWVSVSEMAAACKLVLELILLWGRA
jgi:tripeptide aminopeptidase